MKRIKETLGIWPAYIWMVVVFVIPLFYIIFISFCEKGENWGIIYHFTFSNYKKILDPLYLGIIAKSFGVAALTTVITLLVGYPFAYFLTFFSKTLQRILIFLLIVPFWTNAIIRIYGWIIIMQGEGVVNTFLGSFGIDKIKMLYTNGAVQLGTIYTLLPLMILPIYNSVEKIDKSLLEAARDLGADGWTVFRTVIWKLSLPGVMSGCLMVFVPSIGFFYISDMLGGSNIMLLGNLIKNQFLEARDWPFGAALSVVMAFLAILLIGIYKKFTNGKKVDLLL